MLTDYFIVRLETLVSIVRSIPKEEYRSDPVELVAVKSGVCYDTRDTSVGDSCLVDILEKVNDAYQWHDMEVDLAQKAFVGLWIYRLAHTSSLLEQIESRISAGLVRSARSRW